MIKIKTFKELCDLLGYYIINKKTLVKDSVLISVPINIIVFQNNFSNLKIIESNLKIIEEDVKITDFYYKELKDNSEEIGLLCLGCCCDKNKKYDRFYNNVIYNSVTNLMYSEEYGNITTVFYTDLNKTATLDFIENKRKNYIYTLVEQLNKVNNNYSRIKKKLNNINIFKELV